MKEIGYKNLYATQAEKYMKVKSSGCTQRDEYDIIGPNN